MDLPLLSRIRVRGGRPVVRWLHRRSWLRKRLLATREAALAKGFDADVAWMFALGDLTGDTGGVGGTSPSIARRKMAESIGLVEDIPTGALRVVNRTLPGAAGPIPARVYEPKTLARPSAGLVFVHGGGWVTGDLDTHDTLCRRLALVGDLRVVSIAPRMAPEAPFPAAVDDTLAAFRFVAKNAGDLGIDPARLGIGGDSAGGNLSAVVGLETRADVVKPALTVLVYPSVDATCSQPSHRELGQGYLLTSDSIAWYLGHYVPPASRRDPRVSPLLAADLTGAPAALISIAGFDPLRDEAERYAERLTAAGTKVEVLRAPSLPHGFTLMTALAPACLAATEEIARRTGALLRSEVATINSTKAHAGR